MNTSLQRPFLLPSTQNYLCSRGFKGFKLIRKIYDPFEAQGPQPVKDFLPKNKNVRRTIFSWGETTTGSLGIVRFIRPDLKKNPQSKPIEHMPQPTMVDFFKDFKVVDVAAGHGFSLFAVNPEKKSRTDKKTGMIKTQASSLYGTGVNSFNQLGRQEFQGKRMNVLIEPVPIYLPIDSDDKIKKVAAGRCHSIVLTEKGNVFSFGNNCHGQLGRTIIPNEDYKMTSLIHRIDLPEEVMDIVCGQDHTMFLMKSGRIYSCGLGADGQTGLESYGLTSTPTLIRGDIEGEKIVQVACSADTVLAVSDKGDVFGWGNSEYMQLDSVSLSEQINVPRKLSFKSKSIGKVKRVTAGGSSCCLINERNEVYVWGFGILGKGPKIDQLREPSLIPKTIFNCDDVTGNPENQVVDVVAGLRHFAAITSLGDLYTWGKNRSGCLGQGGHKRGRDPPDLFYPLRVDIPASVSKVSLGVDHSLALCRSFV